MRRLVVFFFVFGTNMARYKYPRTPHLPWSPGASSDDVLLSDCAHFVGQEVVITEKMDGENTTIYADAIHARSLDSAHHPSRSWVKALQGRLAALVPAGWRLCGENLFATHSLHYTALPSYFLLFSVWDEQNRCLSWEDTQVWAALLEVEVVPVLYRGIYDEKVLRSLIAGLDVERQEGLVLRNASSFAYADFANNVGKWVRQGHVTTDAHWMSKPVVPNQLKESP